MFDWVLNMPFGSTFDFRYIDIYRYILFEQATNVSSKLAVTQQGSLGRWSVIKILRLTLEFFGICLERCEFPLGSQSKRHISAL